MVREYAAKKQRDHSAPELKIELRRMVLERIDAPAPVVLESHGGVGRIWADVYAGLPFGFVFEVDETKAAILARQRPTWAVYEADVEVALAAGACGWLPVDVLDVDPYGSPWATIGGFLESDREFAPAMWIVVQDGLRVAIRSGGAWRTDDLVPLVERYGNDLYDVYLDASRELLEHKAIRAGYRLDRFAGYYCGYQGTMTHWAARLVARPAGT